MPRCYRMGEREASVQATRERIIDAAIELYGEVGISAATMREIGLRADVAPGTLRHHFSTRDDLDRAMVERMSERVILPDLSIFAGARTIEQRLGRLLQAGGVFLDQARPLYRMWLREPMLTGPWNEKGVEFGRRWDELIRAALGPIAGDEQAVGLVGAVLQPEFFDAIRRDSGSTDEAANLIATVVGPWFAGRAKEASRAAASRGREPRAD